LANSPYDRLVKQAAGDSRMTGQEARAALLLRRINLSFIYQHRIAGHRADFALPDWYVAIEVDGHPFHRTPEGKRRDAQLDEAMQAEGWSVVRLSPDAPSETWETQIREILRRKRSRVSDKFVYLAANDKQRLIQASRNGHWPMPQLEETHLRGWRLRYILA